MYFEVRVTHISMERSDIGLIVYTVQYCITMQRNLALWMLPRGENQVGLFPHENHVYVYVCETAPMWHHY